MPPGFSHITARMVPGGVRLREPCMAGFRSGHAAGTDDRWAWHRPAWHTPGIPAALRHAIGAIARTAAPMAEHWATPTAPKAGGTGTD